MTIMQVAIGKGITLDVDTDRLNTDVSAHAMYIGLRNILMDSHASATAKNRDPREMAEKKLESMYAGVVRAAGERTTDKVAQEIVAQAKLAVDTALASKGVKKSKVPNYKELVSNYVKKHEAALREEAEIRVTNARTAAESVSLDDLGL